MRMKMWNAGIHQESFLYHVKPNLQSSTKWLQNHLQVQDMIIMKSAVIQRVGLNVSTILLIGRTNHFTALVLVPRVISMVRDFRDQEE